MRAEDVIRTLGLAPHPEGGHYREIFRDTPEGGGRGAVTSIYFLLDADETSAWHRIDATEIWNFHAGATLELTISIDGKSTEVSLLGNDLSIGARPQVVVPPRAWQSAKPRGGWSLLGCTVAPAFDFDGFELAPKGWEPGGGSA